MRRFEGKVAIITGGASGIGLATARRIASEGGCVAIVDIASGLDEIALAMQSAGAPDAIGMTCDVGRQDEVESAVDRTVRQFGKMDILVNNAAVMLFKRIAELDAADWQEVLSTNLFGAAYFLKAAFRTMREGGAIVNVASIHAECTSPMLAPYAASKAALLALTRTAAIEGQELGIRVNAVEPGAIDTPLLWNNPNVQSGEETISPADVGNPEDVAAAIAFLASSDAAFITGASLRVDGGRLARL